MTTILIAQMYFGRGMMSATGDESKATFTMEQVEAALVLASQYAGKEITLDNAEDEDFDVLFDGPDAPARDLFFPNFGEESFGDAIKKALAGEQVFVEEEETLHGMALDLNNVSRYALMAEMRKRWGQVDVDDAAGWD